MDASDSGAHPMGGGVGRRNPAEKCFIRRQRGTDRDSPGCVLRVGETVRPWKADADTGVPTTPALKKFVDPLPRPMTAIPDPSVYPGADYYDITMRQGSLAVPPGPRARLPCGVTGRRTRTDPHKPIGMGYLGPTISVTRDHPTVAKYRNELPTTHLFQFVIDVLRKGDPQLTPIPPPPYKTTPPASPERQRVERRTPARRFHRAAVRRACRSSRTARTASTPSPTPPWTRAGSSATKRSSATPTASARRCSGTTITPWG